LKGDGWDFILHPSGDELTNRITINGINSIERDYEFDDPDKYRSGGIRLYYNTKTPILEGLKDGILLEAGFDTVAPNSPLTISSWVWDYLVSINSHANYINNNATSVLCYNPGYTLIEKLQTIIRKFRNLNVSPNSKNFLRQYYDIFCLLGNDFVVDFIDTEEYQVHKAKRIKGKDGLIPIAQHPAFLLNDLETRTALENKYISTAKLYYKGQPPFSEVVDRIQNFLPIL
jgi:hypothetical protein